METKTCIKCGETKEVSFFRKDRNTCKACFYKYKKDHRKIHGKRIRETEAKYREKNLERIQEKRKSLDQKNKEKIRISNKNYVKNNIEKVKANRNKWRYKNRNIINTQVSLQRESCCDWYIKAHLKREGFPPAMITPELIETRRLMVKCRRELRGET